jgi:hypothetical protein
MISAGRLRFTATGKRESTVDDLGKKEKTPTTTLGTFRCDLRDTGANEIAYGEGVSAVKSFDVLARWQAIQAIGLLETDVLEIDGMTLQILGIRNEAQRDRLATITVEEIR